VFFRHKGKNNQGQLVRYFDFIAGRKWWVDILHMEMQRHRRGEKPQTPIKATATTLSDL